MGDDFFLKRHATEADLDLVPETHTAEIIDGDLHAFPRPKTFHQSAQFELGELLGPARRRPPPDGWVILPEVQIAFQQKWPHLLIPDLSGWRRARMPEMPDVATVELAPDWVCEGMSPSTARHDRGRKTEIYAAAGIPHLWFFDSALQLVETFELVDGRYRMLATASDERTTLAPFDIEIDFSQLWRR
jgi:Uma2 family endonuclease